MGGMQDFDHEHGYRFPYPILIIAITWILLALFYAIGKWRQKPKSMYIIPRVFVLCSPRTVQFHYELILRVGLPSCDFNPDKHDIDITIHGHQKNEVVPMTRLNTKTLFDEPLITSLSIIVYRLVEMPALGYLVLRHSGPYRAWLYVYDFTVIDLSTNKEHYFTLNQYIGSLNRQYHLEDSTANVHYPIDDVPLPQWTTDETYLILYSLMNCIMLSMTVLPINCSYMNDIASIFLASLNGCCVLLFLVWLLYYYSRWDSERKEYFNLEGSNFCPGNGVLKIAVVALSTLVGATAIYFALFITDWRETLVWALATLNSSIYVIGIWNIARQAELGQAMIAFGLKVRGIETEIVGMKYSEMISDFNTKSGSASIDGLTTDSTMSLARGLGPRSSVKSFGFDPLTGHPSRRIASRIPYSRISGGSIGNPSVPPGHSSSKLDVPPLPPPMPPPPPPPQQPPQQAPQQSQKNKSTSKRHKRDDSVAAQVQHPPAAHHKHPTHSGVHDKHQKSESRSSSSGARHRAAAAAAQKHQ